MTKNKILSKFDKFIENPTNLSLHIIKIASKSDNIYNKILNSNKILDRIKIRLIYLNSYQKTIKFVNQFDDKKLPSKIDMLFNELSIVFDYISLNNIALSYSYIIEKKSINPIITKEDQKLLYLSNFYNKKISFDKFNKKFGHYGLNAFELSSIRFSEYSKIDLIKISKHLKDFQLTKILTLHEYLKKKNKKMYPVYCTLKEELRYIALLIISELRFKILCIQKNNKIKNIFNKKYNEISW